MVPAKPKIYHIVHCDRLESIAADGFLWCDSAVLDRESPGTTIGMAVIKQRRLSNRLASHENLHVGDCVPFYFCPRSIMLYLIHCDNNPDLAYHGGQEPVVHLEADLAATVQWAKQNQKRWAFTLSNAGSSYFEDFADLAELHKINWRAIANNVWAGRGVASEIKEGKQAEFLLENQFPWSLVERIGVCSAKISEKVGRFLTRLEHRPALEVKPEWYY